MAAAANEFISAYMSLDDIFSPAECRLLLDCAGPVPEAYREKLAYIMPEINKRYYRFAITGIKELELVELPAGSRQDWTVDLAGEANISRKISFIVFLSKPEDYQNGKIIFSMTRDIHDISQKQGSLLLFPCYRPYKINLVTAGRLLMLRGWVSGAPFK